jgi:sortase A
MNLNRRNKKSSTQIVTVAIVTLLGTLGIALIGSGLWVKAKAGVAQFMLHRAFEETVSSSADIQTKPWYWADIKPFARLNVPHLNVSSVILNNTSGEALAFGPGHIANTPLPGEMGSSVFAAHRDTHFSWLKNLQNGDRMEVERSDGKKIAFRVKRSWVARYDNSGINADSSGRRLILSTCYPFDSRKPGPLRYMVEAETINTTQLSSIADY